MYDVERRCAKVRGGARGCGRERSNRQTASMDLLATRGTSNASLYDLRFGPARAHCPARVNQSLQLPSRRPYFTKQGLDVHLGEWPMPAPGQRLRLTIRRRCVSVRTLLRGVAQLGLER